MTASSEKKHPAHTFTTLDVGGSLDCRSGAHSNFSVEAAAYVSASLAPSAGCFSGRFPLIPLNPRLARPLNSADTDPMPSTDQPCDVARCLLGASSAISLPVCREPREIGMSEAHSADDDRFGQVCCAVLYLRCAAMRCNDT